MLQKLCWLREMLALLCVRGIHGLLVLSVLTARCCGGRQDIAPRGEAQGLQPWSLLCYCGISVPVCGQV